MRLEAQPLQRALVGWRLRAQDARAGAQHELGRRDAREKRDLRVVILGRERHPVADGPRSALAHHLLLGDVELHAPAGDLEREAALADLREQRRELRGYVGVGVLADAADLRADHVRAHELAGGVEIEGPEHRRRPLLWEQARDALRQRERVQRRLDVGRVDGDRPRVRLGVDRAARLRPRRRRPRSRTGRGARRRGARCAAPGRGRASPADRWSRTAPRRARPCAGWRSRGPPPRRRAGTRTARRPRGGWPRTRPGARPPGRP